MPQRAKLINCSGCDAHISKAATVCPNCGHPEVAKATGTQAIITLIVSGGLLWWWFGGGFDHQFDRQMSNNFNKVAVNAVQQYQIAEQQGDPIQICVQAGFVAAAYLEAKDSVNYNVWKGQESSDCRRAGVPR